MEYRFLCKDVYALALVPIGYNDSRRLEEVTKNRATHWLVAYEWYEDNRERGWKVLVFATDQEGRFAGISPYYVSPKPEAYERARRLAQELEALSMQDRFTKWTEHQDSA